MAIEMTLNQGRLVHHSVGNEAVDGCLVTCEGERKDILDGNHSVGNEAVDGCLVNCEGERYCRISLTGTTLLGMKLWMVAWLPVRVRGTVGYP